MRTVRSLLNEVKEWEKYRGRTPESGAVVTTLEWALDPKSDDTRVWAAVRGWLIHEDCGGELYEDASVDRLRCTQCGRLA